MLSHMLLWNDLVFPSYLLMASSITQNSVSSQFSGGGDGHSLQNSVQIKRKMEIQFTFH